MLKILQARLQQYVNWERPDVQAGFRKGRGTRDQIANIHWIIEKAKKLKKKKRNLLHWLHQSLWLCGSQQIVGKSLKRWEYQTAWPVSWEACMHDKKRQLEPELRVWIWGTVYSRGPSGSPRALSLAVCPFVVCLSVAVSGSCPLPSPTVVLHDAAPFINPGKSGCHSTAAEIIVTAQNIPESWGARRAWVF